ncbi:MAG: adenosylmethionine--8-amino-7-oxononanoate transaminase [Lentisphaeria bacterium]
MNRGYFITGTDTDAGKTAVAAAVLCQLRRSGLDAVPMKPVQTGCTADAAGCWRSPDVDFCLAMAGLPDPAPAEYEQLVPCHFPLPASPHLAAAHAGGRVDVARIVAAHRELQARHGAVVAEGAGGVLVPLDDGGLTMLDLMRALGLPVLLAARPGLGTINHTLLSLNALREAGLTVAGIVFCATTPQEPGAIEADNLRTVARLGGVPVLGVLPHLPDWRPGGRPAPAVFREGMALPELPLPGPVDDAATRAAALWELDRTSLWHPFTPHSALAGEPFPILARGAGIYLYDLEGRRYLDAVSSWWAANLGHCHPRLTAAIRGQAGRLQHSILGRLSHPPAAELAARLVRLFPDPRRRVFFAGDGACAVEAALRVAVQHWHNLGRPGKCRLAAFHGDYHGDTTGAAAVGYAPEFHAAIRPLLFPVVQLPFPDCAACPRRPAGAAIPCRDCAAPCLAATEAVLAEQADELAAVIVEPHCQGAAGMRLYPPAALARLAAACRRHDILLIADEVALGFGRTGRMFSFEHAGIDPDLVCLGKGLSGGTLPMSALVVREAVFDSFGDQPADHTFYHGHTFAGNPVAAAAALACLDVYRDEAIVDRAARLGAVLAEALAPAAATGAIRHLRCFGMIAAGDLEPDAAGTPAAARAQRVRRRLLEQGILVRPLGGTLYLMPPLIIGEPELRALAGAFVAALQAE